LPFSERPEIGLVIILAGVCVWTISKRNNKKKSKKQFRLAEIAQKEKGDWILGGGLE